MKNKFVITFIVILLNFASFSQNKNEYLRQNRLDLNSQQFEFPQNDFKIVGFGAYHGSAKTYKAELHLLKSFIKKADIKYYIPETNYSQAYFFNKFLETGDTVLLKDLVLYFQAIVVQEGTVETFNHWKNLKQINDKLSNDNKIQVIGLDNIAEYKYPIKHILELTDNEKIKLNSLKELENLVKTDTTDFSPYYESYSKKVLRNFINEYEKNEQKYQPFLKDTFAFNHIIRNIKYTFLEKSEREKIIFDNYSNLYDHYKFGEKKQFFKYGIFHLQKSRIFDYPSFFTRLIENGIYSENEVITIMGYLTKSQVLWDKIYDDSSMYKSYTIEGGYGIGDYWKEYFKGIKRLKKNKLSDITLFRLNQDNSPYNSDVELIEIKMFLKQFNSKVLKGKRTTEFIDYAVLICDSKAQTPIEEK